MGKFEIKPSCPALLLCEGEDELQFFRWYIEHLKKETSGLEKIQIFNFGGVNELTGKLKTLVLQDYFNNIKRIAIVRDAERNWRGAMDSVYQSLQSANISEQQMSPQGLYLLPGKLNGNWQDGTLEDLCFQIFDSSKMSEEILRESDAFLKNIETMRQGNFKRYHKNKLHTCFSSTDEFVGAKIGEAARIGAFDWNHEKLKDLKSFLLALVDGL